MDTRRDETDFFRSRGFGKVIGFGERSALVVVDLIVGFTDAAMPLGSDLTAQIDATNRLLDCFHAAGLPVFFTTTAYDMPDLADAGCWALKQDGLATLRTGSNAVEQDPRLRREATDEVVVKKYASSFFGTDLQSRLTSRRVDTLFIAGCTTSGCVRATAVDALQHSFRPMIVQEAVGDRSRQAHQQSLFDLQAKYSDVITLEDACRHLEGIPAPLTR